MGGPILQEMKFHLQMGGAYPTNDKFFAYKWALPFYKREVSTLQETKFWLQMGGPELQETRFYVQMGDPNLQEIKNYLQIEISMIQEG